MTRKPFYVRVAGKRLEFEHFEAARQQAAALFAAGRTVRVGNEGGKPREVRDE